MALFKSQRHKILRRFIVAFSLVTILLGVSGCNTLSFYGQAIRGQYQIFAHEEPIQKLIDNPKTPDRLKSRFELVQRLCHFAETDLKLPADGHYRKYVDVHRSFVVWNVEAAPEFSMQPKTWWYPLVGRLEYRGYFFKPYATNYANVLRRKGYDVTVGGVEAYSTLGWFKDPLLNTFIFNSDAELAETVFHELAHQRVFAHGDTDFNEAFATTVGEEGARRWLQAQGDTAGLEKYQAHIHRNDEFVHLVLKTRARLQNLFGDVRTADGNVKATDARQNVPRAELRMEKQQIYSEFKREAAALRKSWGENTEFDFWFTHHINNAHLNSVAAYYDLVPAFQRLLAENRGDLKKFYEAADRLAKEPKKARSEWLKRKPMIQTAERPGKELTAQRLDPPAPERMH